MKALAKSYINNNLRGIETLYTRSKNPRNSLFYSKLAILELCGWIEMSMDAIVRCCATRNLKSASNRALVEFRVGKTYGFDYQQHFRELIIRVIGLRSLEKVEKSVDAAQFAKLTAALGALKARRDSQAHTYIKGTTLVLDAPSLTRTRFEDVYNGLDNFDKTMKNLGF